MRLITAMLSRFKACSSFLSIAQTANVPTISGGLRRRERIEGFSLTCTVMLCRVTLSTKYQSLNRSFLSDLDGLRTRSNPYRN